MTDPGTLRVTTPIDGTVIVERPLATDQQIATTLSSAVRAQRSWKEQPLAARAQICSRFVDAMLAHGDAVAVEITKQIGRPIAHSPSELRGFEERARHMIGIAEEALAPITPPEKNGFSRFIEREPLGVVLVLAPWNYPYLTAVNSIVPALLAGNAVILKHSAQTPLCAERFAQAFEQAGLPQGVFQFVHCSHSQTATMIGSSEVDFVAFTGSVDGGHAVVRAASERFIGAGLELGGKDPAYVRVDADLEHSAESLVDGAFYNCGQSCCGIERIYVHRDVFDPFVERYTALVRQYVLGDPTDLAVTLGPMVRTRAADLVRRQIEEATHKGAKALIDAAAFPAARAGSPYLAPQVLIDVDHSMAVMTEESFGPVIGIMPVASDEEALVLMNDSRYGLTASVWTSDAAAALDLGRRLYTGTVFMNRCDYLDPALAWTGVKDSGRGCTLSEIGFEALTRPKSYHLRTSL
jgi:acyl-CoA reductase-like NAD-dependent aldehyde dehydrogenase